MKISVNDFVIMAVAAAFGDVPEANVTWSDEGLVAHGSVDVSIAVATDGGLVTPVLRGVETKRLSVIAAEAQSLAQRARDRRLQQHELEGGAFSVSNLGMYGTLEFSAIINPPQSGILAVGAARRSRSSSTARWPWRPSCAAPSRSTTAPSTEPSRRAGSRPSPPGSSTPWACSPEPGLPPAPRRWTATRYGPGRRAGGPRRR